MYIYRHGTSGRTPSRAALRVPRNASAPCTCCQLVAVIQAKRSHGRSHVQAPPAPPLDVWLLWPRLSGGVAQQLRLLLLPCLPPKAWCVAT